MIEGGKTDANQPVFLRAERRVNERGAVKSAADGDGIDFRKFLREKFRLDRRVFEGDDPAGIGPRIDADGGKSLQTRKQIFRHGKKLRADLAAVRRQIDDPLEEGGDGGKSQRARF